MPYFDGRESRMPPEEMLKMRMVFANMKSDNVYFTARDVELGPTNAGLKDSSPYQKIAYLYPRPPTEDLARELYLEDQITESEFECLIEHVLARESEAELFTEV